MVQYFRVLFNCILCLPQALAPSSCSQKFPSKLNFVSNSFKTFFKAALYRTFPNFCLQKRSLMSKARNRSLLLLLLLLLVLLAVRAAVAVGLTAVAAGVAVVVAVVSCWCCCCCYCCCCCCWCCWSIPKQIGRKKRYQGSVESERMNLFRIFSTDYFTGSSNCHAAFNTWTDIL